MGKLVQFLWRDILEEQAPSFDPVEEFFRTKPAAEKWCAAGLSGDKVSLLLGCEQVVAVINGFVANPHLWNLAQWGGAALEYNIGGIYQVWVNALHELDLGFWGFDVGAVFEKARLLGGLHAEPHNDAVDSGYPASFIAPLKGAVREVDLYPMRQQQGPQNPYLFTLADTVGGDQRSAY